jgi:hypothetical protein
VDFSASAMARFLLKRCKYLNFAVCGHISARLAGLMRNAGWWPGDSC